MLIGEVSEKINHGVWGKSLSDEMNITLAFMLDLQKAEKGVIYLTAASCFKLYIDGKMLGFGPNRVAHGYARLSEFEFYGRYLTVEVHSHNVENFCWIKQSPFLACYVKMQSGQEYFVDDFSCFALNDRVQKVQRYSFQRGFLEVYDLKEQRENLRVGDCCFPRVGIEKTAVPFLLPSYTSNPKLTERFPVEMIDSGTIHIDNTQGIWRDRAHVLVGEVLQGYTIDEWNEKPTDEASCFLYQSQQEKGEKYYKIFDFGRAITGFFELDVLANNQNEIYVLFDEIVDNNNKAQPINFTRNDTSNVFKWKIREQGRYTLESFEPYTARYICVVCTEKIDVKIKIRDYENPDIEKFNFDCKDEDLNKMMEACKASFAQNAVDLLSDCPSRERAGWLCDSWFSSVSERIFTGENKVEHAFLENYLLADTSKFEGLLPMCYPADLYFPNIPNWSMWYILEICKYAKIYGKDDLVQQSKKKVDEIIQYFRAKENEYGVLENLEGWVFIEWSVANNDSHICGVNVPTNICYASCLEQAGVLYENPAWIEQATKIRDYVKVNAFDGKFFVDNLIRDKDGKLIKTNNYTEVCQYYAFWFDCITSEEFPSLREELIENLGCHRKEGDFPKLGEPNVFIGIYLRIDLLMRWGYREKVLEECKKHFLDMAKKTGTLWEHRDIRASCVHAFASYVARWIIYGVEGKDAFA